MSTTDKFIESEGGLETDRALGQEELEATVNGHGVSFGSDKRDRGIIVKHCEHTEIH